MGGARLPGPRVPCPPFHPLPSRSPRPAPPLSSEAPPDADRGGRVGAYCYPVNARGQTSGNPVPPDRPAYLLGAGHARCTDPGSGCADSGDPGVPALADAPGAPARLSPLGRGGRCVVSRAFTRTPWYCPRAEHSPHSRGWTRHSLVGSGVPLCRCGPPSGCGPGASQISSEPRRLGRNLCSPTFPACFPCKKKKHNNEIIAAASFHSGWGP